MFNLPMIDNIIDRFTPHALTVRDECRAWALAITDRLDRIADAVDSDDIYSLRRPVTGFAASGAATTQIEVPATDEWILESVIARTNPVAAGTLDIRDANGGALRFAADIPATGGYTGNFAPMRFMGGSELVATMSVPGEFRLVFRYERKRAKRSNVSAGFRNPAPDGIGAGAGQEAENERRHVGSWHPGVPVFGPTAPGANGR